MSYLFMTCLQFLRTDLVFIYAGAAVWLTGACYLLWPLLMTTVNEDLAAVDGINIDLMRLIWCYLWYRHYGRYEVCGCVNHDITIYHLPQQRQRKFANTPEQMRLASVGSTAVFGGLSLSWPMTHQRALLVVISAMEMFMLSQMYRTRA